MISRMAVLEARQRAKDFIKLVDEWEKAYPAKKPSECVGLPAHYGDWHGFGNKHSGAIKAASLLLTRALTKVRQ